MTTSDLIIPKPPSIWTLFCTRSKIFWYRMFCSHLWNTKNILRLNGENVAVQYCQKCNLRRIY